MIYTSDLIKEIITSEAAKRTLDRVSPIYGDAFVALWLFEVIGMQIDDLRLWTDEYSKQVVPQTSTWALNYWEQNYGIPYDAAMTTEKRRERILSYIRDRAPMNPYRLGQVASVAAANAEVEIEENTGKNKFTVWISALPSPENEIKIKAAIDRAKPAHLIYDTEYIQSTTANEYYGGIIRHTKKFTLRQV